MTINENGAVVIRGRSTGKDINLSKTDIKFPPFRSRETKPLREDVVELYDRHKVHYAVLPSAWSAASSHPPDLWASYNLVFIQVMICCTARLETLVDQALVPCLMVRLFTGLTEYHCNDLSHPREMDFNPTSGSFPSWCLILPFSS